MCATKSENKVSIRFTSTVYCSGAYMTFNNKDVQRDENKSLRIWFHNKSVSNYNGKKCDNDLKSKAQYRADECK